MRLGGRRFRHAKDVLRAKKGDELVVGLLNGRIGSGTITSIGQASLDMTVRLDRDPPHKLPLTLILALPRPKVIRRVLRTVSAMGVKRLILISCFRVEKSYWQSPFLEPESIREQLILGLEQACDTVLPEVELKLLFKPFVEDELPGIIAETLPILAHPAAETACPRGVQDSVTLIIGPEGGFIQYEVDKLIASGCRPMRMGNRILNVEAAVPALISRLF